MSWLVRCALGGVVLVGMLSVLSGCVHPVVGIPDSDGQRIWVMQGDKVYRCADGAAENEPPKPVCTRAPLKGSGD